MKLTSDHPYWLLRNGISCSYPSLQQDCECDVIVVGAGVTGAMISDELAGNGYSVVTVDRRDVCTGSTAASTALLQYEIDVSLCEMREMIGVEPADRAYKLSHQSIDRIEALVQSLSTNCKFERKKSIYLAYDRKSALALAREARARQSLGLDVEYHDESEVKSVFGLTGTAALSSRQAASCDPYQLAQALLDRAVSRGGKVFDRTKIEKYDCRKDGVSLTTEGGFKLSAKWLIIASGYESTELLRGENFVDLDNTYALVSEPLDNIRPWDYQWMLWEAKEPYLYLRITSDGRLLAGGEDDRFHSPTRRDLAIEKRSKTIEAKIRALIPDLQWRTDYRWAGTFGKTKDGLAYIGAHSKWPSTLWALCFGGNGITFTAIATSLMTELLKTSQAPDTDLFRFGR